MKETDSLAAERRDFVFRSPPKFDPVTRGDVHGVDAILREVDPVIQPLHDFRKFQELGVLVQGGVLLYGPKRTGKTYIARYIATESGARFLDIDDFPRPIVNKRRVPLGAEDIRELYRLAREYVAETQKPLVLFCDEFDEVESSILEQLRMEIDGVRGRPYGVFLIVTAAVDSPNFLDEGLFGPGRVDLHIPFTYLGFRSKVAILKYYLSKYQHDPPIDVESLVHLLPDETTPALIEALVRKAYDDACRGQKEKPARLEQEHLKRRCIRILTGFVVDQKYDEKNTWMVACHEAGHAALLRLLGLPVQVVTILPTVDQDCASAGKTISTFPENEVISLETLEHQMAGALGGMLAEELLGFPRSISSKSDLGSVTSGAQELVESFLKGKELRKSFGCLVLNRSKSEYSDSLKKIGEQDVAQLVKKAEKRARALIKRRIGRERLERVARALIERETLLQNELDELLKF